MTALLNRLVALLDNAVDTVISAAVDVLIEHWIEAGEMPAHVHGAWCHPSADGCPDRPGM